MSEEIRRLLRGLLRGGEDARFADVQPAEQQAASEHPDKENLRRFTKALRAGRDERREAHSYLNHYLDEALPVRTVQNAKDVVAVTDEARARNMLVTRREEVDEPGMWVNTEMADIKRRDQYVKRPSVRAMKSQQPDRIAERKASVERWRQRKVLALDVEELKLYMSPDIENLELPHSRADQKRIAREDAEVAKLRSGDRRLLEKFQGDKAWTRERGLFEKRRESVLALSDEKVRQAIKARKQQREHRAQHGPDLW